MKRLENFTSKDLWNLRSQIVLDSLYYSDYRNNFDIEEHSCSVFFDGFVSHIQDSMREDGIRFDNNDPLEWNRKFKEYDNEENLLEYWSRIEDFGWVEYCNWSVYVDGDEVNYSLTKKDAVELAEKKLFENDEKLDSDIEVGYYDESGEFIGEPAKYTTKWFTKNLAEKFVRDNAEEIKKLRKDFQEVIEKLKEDFQWIVECGYSNAVYGYSVHEVFKSNTTAKELMFVFKESKEIEGAILACSRVGWAQCAGDASYVIVHMNNALKEA